MPIRSRPARRAGPGPGRGLRTLVEVVSLAGVFALIAMAGLGYMGVAGKWLGRGGEPSPVQDPASFRLGSILVVPFSGRICEERQFDNMTGRIVADAQVKCESRLDPHFPTAEEAITKDARMRAIFDTFKR
ncbi:MAG: hypothetical protein ACK4UO_19970 [Pseudolabrys sp.]